MKSIGILLMLISVLLLVGGWIYGWLYLDYYYEVGIGQYIRLADDASTAEKKLEYLKRYEGAIRLKIVRNDARFIFKQERLTRDTQLVILGTLQTRLQDSTEMNPLSFEYQTAMQQITGQEFEHELTEINDIIWGCWYRQSGLVIFCLWFAWLPWVILFFIGLAVRFSND